METKGRSIFWSWLNNDGGVRTAKKWPLDSVTENLMDAVKHALSSSEHIVDLVPSVRGDK